MYPRIIREFEDNDEPMIYGGHKWDVKFVKSHTKTLADFSYGKTSKYVEYVVIFVNIFLGMEAIYKNIGVSEIELSRM